MTIRVATIEDIRAAQQVIASHITPAPLIRSYDLERELGVVAGRRVWFKDYGWTPVGSFKLLGALNWVDRHQAQIGDRPVAAHSSGNFASGISFACSRYGKLAKIVMPDTAPEVKFKLTRRFGAEVFTYNIALDHETGERDRLTREIAEQERAVQASPYDDADVIAGNGVGGLEIAEQLRSENRGLSHFLCQVSGGGLMAGHALAIRQLFPDATVTGVEPRHANDFEQSLARGARVRLEHPTSICDGLLSYDVGEHNWPLLREHVSEGVSVPDRDTQQAMKWLYNHHGLRSEPSGAIALAALLCGHSSPNGEADIVVVISGRNTDESSFQRWIGEV